MLLNSRFSPPYGGSLLQKLVLRFIHIFKAGSLMFVRGE